MVEFTLKKFETQEKISTKIENKKTINKFHRKFNLYPSLTEKIMEDRIEMIQKNYLTTTNWHIIRIRR